MTTTNDETKRAEARERALQGITDNQLVNDHAAEQAAKAARVAEREAAENVTELAALKAQLATAKKYHAGAIETAAQRLAQGVLQIEVVAGHEADVQRLQGRIDELSNVRTPSPIWDADLFEIGRAMKGQLADRPLAMQHFRGFAQRVAFA